jgi:RecA/RadA recombinase
MAKLPAYFSSLIKAENAALASALLDAKKNSVVTTGSYTIDWATKGGIARGELTLLWGSPGSGKSTLMLKMMAHEQKAFPDKVAVLIDTEYSFDANRAKQLGVDMSRLVIFQSNMFEDAVAPLAKIAADIIKDKSVCFIGLDSVKGFQSINEQAAMDEGKVDSAANAYGGISKSINPTVKILLRLAAETNCMVILCNHANMNMDPRTSKYYPYVLTGGQLLKHLCSTTIFMDKVENKKSKIFAAGVHSVNETEISIGNVIRLKVTKSRRTVEGKVAEVAWNLETGEFEQRNEELFRLATSLNVLRSEKQTYYFGPDAAASSKIGSKQGVMIRLSGDEKFLKRLWDACQDVKYNPSLEVNADTLDVDDATTENEGE